MASNLNFIILLQSQVGLVPPQSRLAGFLCARLFFVRLRCRCEGLSSCYYQFRMQFKNNKNRLFYKYNKITQQQKFHLLMLVMKEKKSIKQAARIVEINYSTAKTIIFFHRNHIKSYQFDFRTHHRAHRQGGRVVAGVTDIANACSTFTGHSRVGLREAELVEIVSTIGSKSTNIDLNSLQTRFMDNHLDHTDSHSPKDYQLMNTLAHSQLELKYMQICQCERRTTRAQSAKQAANVHFYPPPSGLEHRQAGLSSAQHQQQ